MTEGTVGIAVLGAGFIAGYHLAGLAAAGGSSVRVLAGRSLERAVPLAARFDVADVVTDWRTALERDDVDAVVICTPDDTHELIAIAAAVAGKAILLQKPMAASVAACRRIIAAAASAGVDLQVSFMHRWFPEVDQARAWLSDGMIGRVHSVRIRNATPGPDWGDWFFAGSRAAGGVVDQLGVHGIDLALQLVGDIREVSARVATVLPERTLRDGRVVAVETADTALASYGFTAGALGTHEMSQVEVAGCDRFRLELYGEAGTIWLRSELGPAAVYAPQHYGKEWHAPALPQYGFGQRHHAAWLAGVRSQAARQATAHDALRGMQVVEAIRLSDARNGTSVRVAESAA
ncbi:MAG: Gfo/Idh/MocA family oxidoreductase [Betaproteobacteria bacterium]